MARWNTNQQAIDDVIALHRGGYSSGAIATKLQMTRSAVAGITHRAIKSGIVKARGKVPLSARVADWMAEHGGSIDQCAADIVVSKIRAQFAWNEVLTKLGLQTA